MRRMSGKAVVTAWKNFTSMGLSWAPFGIDVETVAPQRCERRYLVDHELAGSATSIWYACWLLFCEVELLRAEWSCRS